MATIDTYKIKVEVDGTSDVNKLNNEVNTSTKNLKNLENQTDNTGKAITNFGSIVDKAGKLAAGAFTLIAGSALKAADDIIDVADATQTTGGFVKALAVSLEQAGGKFDSAGKILTEFYKSLDEVANLNEKTQAAFVQLGISLDELRGKTNIEIFQLVIERLAKMEDGFARTALGIRIFGKEFANIDPKALQSALETKDIVKLEAELRKAAAAVAAMEHNFRMLQDAALRLLAPLIGEVDNMRLSAEQADKVMKLLAGTIIVAFGAKAVAGAIAMTRAIIGMAGAASLLAKNPVLRALALGGLAIGGVAAGVSLMGDEEPKVAPPAAGGADQQLQSGIYQEILDNQKKIAEVQARSNQYLKLNNIEVQKYQKAINGSVGLLDEQAARIKISAEIDRDANQQKLSIQQKIDEEKKKEGYVNQALIVELEKQLKIIDQQAAAMKILKMEELTNLEAVKQRTVFLEKENNLKKLQIDQAYESLRAEEMRKVINGQATEEGMRNTLEEAKIRADSAKRLADLQTSLALATSQSEKNRILELIDLEKKRADNAIADKQREVQEKTALEESYAAGTIKALKQISDGFKPYNMAQEAVNKTWGTISQSVDSFVETGKFKFSDFARSIVADLAKMIAKALIFRAISGFLGSVGIPLPGLASGGPAEKGKPYVVGEKGPELFVPKDAGTVIPNNKIASASSNMAQPMSQPVVNNYTYNNNISAVDAKSVAALFYENRKSLFGASMAAQKELPYGARG